MQKFQDSGHLMLKANSLEKALMLGKIEGKRRGWQKMRRLHGITNSINMNFSGLWETVEDRGAVMMQSMWLERVRPDLAIEQQEIKCKKEDLRLTNHVWKVSQPAEERGGTHSGSQITDSSEGCPGHRRRRCGRGWGMGDPGPGLKAESQVQGSHSWNPIFKVSVTRGRRDASAPGSWQGLGCWDPS